MLLNVAGCTSQQGHAFVPKGTNGASCLVVMSQHASACGRKPGLYNPMNISVGVYKLKARQYFIGHVPQSAQSDALSDLAPIPNCQNQSEVYKHNKHRFITPGSMCPQRHEHGSTHDSNPLGMHASLHVSSIRLCAHVSSIPCEVFTRVIALSAIASEATPALVHAFDFPHPVCSLSYWLYHSLTSCS